MNNSNNKNLKSIGLNYKHFFALSIIIFIFFAFSLYIYKINVAPQIHTKHASINYNMPKMTNTNFQNPVYETIGSLNKLDHLEQNFISNNDIISEFAVRFWVGGEINNGKIEVSLLNKATGKTEFNQTLDMSSIANGSDTVFKLNKDLNGVKGQAFSIVIDVPESNTYNQISLVKFEDYGQDYYSDDNALHINGQTTDFKICFKIMSDENMFIKSLFVIFVFIVAVLTAIIYYLIFVKRIKIETLFLILAVSLGIIYMFVFPPFSVADEGIHVGSTYRYSNQLLGLGFGNGDFTAARYADFVANPLYKTPNIDTYRYIGENLFSLCHNNSIREIALPHAGNAFQYIFTTLGVTWARLLNLGFLPMLMMGRLFNFIFYLICIYFIIKRIPFGKMIIFSVALLPPTIHSAVSFSYDAVINVLALFFIGTVIYLAYSKNDIKWWDILALSLSGGLLVASKASIYILICFICLIIPVKRFKNKSLYFISIVCIFISCVIFLLFCNLSNILSISTQTDTTTHTNNFSVLSIFDYPKNFVKLFYETLKIRSYFYFVGILGKELGWLNISIPFFVSIGFLFILLLSSFKTKKQPQFINIKTKSLLIAISIITFCFFIVVAYTWTQQGSKLIEGVQGRYLIPILPLLLFSVRNSNLTFERDISRKLICSIFLLQIFTILSAIETLFSDSLTLVF